MQLSKVRNQSRYSIKKKGIVLTSPITTPLHRNNRITLESPRGRLALLSPDKRLVTRRNVRNVQVRLRLLGLDGSADGEGVGSGFGAEDGECRCEWLSISIKTVRSYYVGLHTVLGMRL